MGKQMEFLTNKETKKSKRKMTTDILETKLEDDFQIRAKSFELEGEVMSLRLQVASLKKKLATNEENYQKMFNQETVGLEEKIRLKLEEYKVKISEENLKHTEEMQKLTKEMETTKLQVTTTLREKAYF